MVLTLIADVRLYRFNLGSADREGSIPGLPVEVDPLLADKPRGVCFEFVNRMLQAHARRQQEKQVRMVGHTTRSDEWEFVLPGNFGDE